MPNLPPLKHQDIVAPLEALLDSLGVASLLIDHDERALRWNRQFLDMFPEHAGFIQVGEPFADILRRFYRNRLDAAEMPNVEVYVADGVQRHRQWAAPFEFLHRGDWLRLSVLLLPGLGHLRAWAVSRSSHDGEGVALQIAQDGKAPALEAIRHIADGLMVRDPAGRITLSNRRFAELYGLAAPEQSVGMTFPDLLDLAWAGAPGAETARLRWVTNSRFAGAPFEIPLPGDRWVRVRDYRAHDGSLVSTHVDVTDLVRLQSSANAAQRRAEELAAQLRTEMEERKRAEARTIHTARLVSLGEMATGLAHELNQPLATLALAADIAKARLESLGIAAIPQVLDGLEHIATAAMRARGIVDHVRRFGQADDDSCAPEPVDLCGAVRGALGLTRAAIRFAGITVETRLPETPVLVMGDLNAMEQVILNLLMNARDAVAGNRPTGGAIRLCLDQAGDEALLTVADNGGGFCDAALQRAFEPFFTTRPQGKGTGIGLSIAYSMIRSAGGSISLSNSEDGAVVCVRLPTHAVPGRGSPA